MISIQKQVLLLSEFHFKEFSEYLINTNADLPYKLVTTIRHSKKHHESDYNSNASTLPRQKKIESHDGSTAKNRLSSLPSRSKSSQQAIYNYQPPSTKISATTPLSTASLIRSLSSARKLTQ